MSEILQLHSFRLTRVHIKHPFPEENAGDDDGKFLLDYNVFRNPDSELEWGLALKVVSIPPRVKGHKEGLDLEVECMCHFTIPEEWDESRRDFLVRYNGGMLAYGMLRGQVAILTGAFPTGSILLPTLDWKQVVFDLEKAKAEAQMESSQTQRSKRPPAKAAAKASKKRGASGTATAKKKSTTASRKKPATD